jgi:hypothetical protein
MLDRLVSECSLVRPCLRLYGVWVSRHTVRNAGRGGHAPVTRPTTGYAAENSSVSLRMGRSLLCQVSASTLLCSSTSGVGVPAPDIPASGLYHCRLKHALGLLGSDHFLKTGTIPWKSDKDRSQRLLKRTPVLLNDSDGIHSRLLYST